MKQGTQFALPVEIGMSLDEVSRIEFVFKQKSCKGFPAIKSNVWPDDCTRQEGQNIILNPGQAGQRYHGARQVRRPYYRYQHERRGYQRCHRSCGGGFERENILRAWR